MTVSRNSPAPDLPSLTGLRFWAAFSILLNHLLLSLVSRNNPLLSTWLSNSGVLGMNAFFVLSGFIIHYNYSSKLQSLSLSSLWDFFVARFSRLYPLYILLFSIDFFTNNTSFLPSDLAQALPFYLTMSQSWIYHQISTGASVTYMFGRSNIAWSISTEMLMYSSYPFILMLMMRDRSAHRVRLACTVVIVMTISLGLRYLNNNLPLVDAAGVKLLGPSVSLEKAGAYSFAIWLVFLSPYVRVFEFVVGAATAHVLMRLRDTPVRPFEAVAGPALALLSLAFIVATSLPPGFALPLVPDLNKAIGYYPFLAVIIFACGRYPRALSTRFFAFSPFVRLGEYSYSIYLFHIFVYQALPQGSASGPVTALRVVAVWSMVFSCASVLFHFVEMPARRYLRDRLTGRRWRPSAHDLEVEHLLELDALNGFGTRQREGSPGGADAAPA